MSTFLLIVALTAVTYFTRIIMIVLIGKTRLTPRMAQVLNLTVPAVFMAIVAPVILTSAGALNLTVVNARIPAALVAAVIAFRTRSMALTIGAGMLTFWLWRFLQ
jgi:branched-subunit amino acid transport protein